MNNTKTQETPTFVLAAIIAALLMSQLTGCAGSTGWRFEIGVSPVKQLDNRAGLTQEREETK